MKKFSMWLFAAVMAVVLPFSLTSCGGEEPGGGGDGGDDGNKPDDVKKETVSFLQGGYFGDVAGNGTAVYLLAFGTGDITMSAEGPVGNKGDYISLQIFSTETGTMFPEVGEYKSAGTYMAGSILPGNLFNQDGQESVVGSYVYVFEGGQAVDYKLIKVANMTLTGGAANATVEFNVVFADGSKAAYSFKGAMPVTSEVRDPYELESESVVTVEETIGNVSLSSRDYPDYGLRSVYIEMMGADFEANLELYANLEGSINGTYSIDDTKTLGSCLASQGVEGDQAYPSFAYYFDDEHYVVDAWFFVEGTVTISDESIVVNATSAKGSTVKVTYNGEWSVVASASMPSKRMSIPNVPKFVPYVK